MFDTSADLKLTFEVSQLNGKSMSLTFLNSDKIETFDQLANGVFVYETKLEFPAKFSIQVSGKGPLDTEVDAQGNVVKDLYIKLSDINVDGLSCHPTYVHQSINLITNGGEKILTNYWGFNGHVNLDFDYQNSFFWSLHCVDAH